MDGILVVDKRPEKTSHDIVDEVRRSVGTRSVGHAGTLDPFATGVLVVAIGKATKFIRYLRTDPKEYVAELLLGISTDTDDITGKVLTTKDASEISESDLLEAIERFKGRIEQVPPVYAAIKVRGEPLYKAARRGEKVSREPRVVEVYELDLLSFAAGNRATARLRVVCSAGTYIRALARDIGDELDAGGTLSALRRSRSGIFSIDEALASDKLVDRELVRERIIPLRDALRNLPSAEVRAEAVKTVSNGRPVSHEMISSVDAFKAGDTIGVVHGDELLAVGRALMNSDASKVGSDVIVKLERVASGSK